MYDSWRGFAENKLNDEWHDRLTEMARVARGHILKMTTVAGSGHPGGSMSSLEIYLSLYNFARVDPRSPREDDRDRIIISHGHTSPGVYSALAAVGFFEIEPALHGFRQAGSPFEGHVEQSVPGIEWDTGNLGQGLSVGIGKSIYARLSNQSFHTYVVMGDGEQQKGQIAEARRKAIKFGLHDITTIIDYNRLQISGKIENVMPTNIRKEWEAGGWTVLEIDGHDFLAIYDALRKAREDKTAPYMILAQTVMGKNVSFMENDENYHGAPVSRDKIGDALKELNVEDDVDRLIELRRQSVPGGYTVARTEYPTLKPGVPVQYGVSDKKDNRSAFGSALVSVADANSDGNSTPIAVFDCDLAKSVKTHAFFEKYPDRFFQCGITEHSTAVTAGALSTERAIAVWADFGMFALAETYNQARLNDINHSNLKMFCTHSGINVGEDGKTHQSIDYFGLLNSTFGWKVITPADPNQTDRIVRHALTNPGNYAVIMGRSIAQVITDENGLPYFGENYEYRYGQMETIRSGEKTVIVAAGNMLGIAFEAWQQLDKDGIRVGLISVSDWSDISDNDLDMLGSFESIVVIEDHNIKTGLGMTLGSLLFERSHSLKMIRMGLSDYAPSGRSDSLYSMLGLDAKAVMKQVRLLLNNSATAGVS